MQGGNPITAVAYAYGSGGAQIEVYWRNLRVEIVFSKFSGRWGNISRIVGDSKSSPWFASLQWRRGTRIRLYHQDTAGVVVEHCSEDGCRSWVMGQLRVGGVLYSRLDHGNLIWQVSQ